MVYNLYGYSALYLRVLAICYDEDAVNPWHELVDGTYAPVYLPSVGIACRGGYILSACFLGPDIYSPLGIQHRIVPVHPGDDSVYGEMLVGLHLCLILLRHLLCDQSQSSGWRRMVCSILCQKFCDSG